MNRAPGAGYYAAATRDIALAQQKRRHFMPLPLASDRPVNAAIRLDSQTVICGYEQ
jgi:hypothetical protein